MATEIALIDLTNGSTVNQEWQGTGVFDTLIAAVNKNIEIQFNKGRITGSNYADVYLGSMQAVLQQSVEFLLRKDLTEAQIDSEMKNIELKTAQLAAERNKTEAELEKQWGYDVTRDANGELVLGDSTGEGKVDKELAQITAQVAVLELQDDELNKKILILEEQRKAAKAEVVIKDKEAAKLGLDNVVKNAETERVANSNMVYTPRYGV